MTFQEFEQTIKTYVANDKLAEAISLMSAYFKDDPDINDIILQSGRYRSLKKDQQNGTVDYNTLQTAFNQLRANILNFLEQHQPATTNAQDTHHSSIEERMNLSHARISILWLLQDNPQQENGLTISKIHQLANTHSRKFIVLALQEMADAGLIERNKVEKTVYWRLTEKGDEIADRFKASSIWNG